jgi:hypothetical protein
VTLIRVALKTSENVVVSAITHESVTSHRKLRVAAGIAKIFQILAVVFGTEIDWHLHHIGFRPTGV